MNEYSEFCESNSCRAFLEEPAITQFIELVKIDKWDKRPSNLMKDAFSAGWRFGEGRLSCQYCIYFNNKICENLSSPTFGLAVTIKFGCVNSVVHDL